MFVSGRQTNRLAAVAQLEEEVIAESEASCSYRRLFCLLCIFFKLSLAPSLQQGRR